MFYITCDKSDRYGRYVGYLGCFNDSRYIASHLDDALLFATEELAEAAGLQAYMDHVIDDYDVCPAIS